MWNSKVRDTPFLFYSEYWIAAMFYFFIKVQGFELYHLYRTLIRYLYIVSFSNHLVFYNDIEATIKLQIYDWLIKENWHLWSLFRSINSYLYRHRIQEGVWQWWIIIRVKHILYDRRRPSTSKTRYTIRTKWHEEINIILFPSILLIYIDLRELTK
jgi:hypothetical protein